MLVPNDSMKIAEAFNEFLKSLETRREDRDRLGPLSVVIRDVLRSSQLFRGVARDITAGSYGRSTAVHPLHDVDIFLILKPDIHPPPEKERNPEGLLKKLEWALREEFATKASIRLQFRSIGLRFQRETVGFDVVPSFSHPSLENVYWIPDISRRDWICTNPEKQHAKLKEANQRAGTKLNPLIKLIKHWNYINNKPFRSFYLEVMCYNAFASAPLSFADGFRLLCEHLSRQVLLKCPDPAGVGPNIDDGATPSERQRRQELFLTLAQKASNALAYEKRNELDLAHNAWRELFGPRWPA
jgi:hypothetical protein